MAEYINPKDFHQALVERRKLVDNYKLENKEIPPISDYICKSLMEICKRLSYSPNFINYTYIDEMIDDAIVMCVINADKFEFDIISMKYEGEVDTTALKGKFFVGTKSGGRASFKSFNKKTGRIIGRQIGDVKFSQKEILYVENELQENSTQIQLTSVSFSNAFAYFTQCAWNAFVNRIKLEKEETLTKAAIFQSVHSNFLDIQDHDSDENYNNGYVDFMKSNTYLDVDISKATKQKKPKKSSSKSSIEGMLE